MRRAIACVQFSSLYVSKNSLRFDGTYPRCVSLNATLTVYVRVPYITEMFRRSC